MFTKLTTEQISQEQPLFAPLNYFLTVDSIFAGNTPGLVYVDGETAVMFFGHRLFLAGGGENTAVYDTLVQLLQDVVIPETKAHGGDAIVIHPTEDWIPHLPAILEMFKPIQANRFYYRLDARDKEGVAIIYENEVVGWCMSEYNTSHRCELGIESSEAHRRKGLAVGMGTAVIQTALSHGIYDIGWTCWEKNHPSRATAEKLGFSFTNELPVWIIVF